MTAPSTATVGVVVVDDDPGIRMLLEVTIDLDPRFDLLGIAQSAEQLRECVSSARRSLDLVLLDVTLPDADGVDLAVELHQHQPGTRVVLFTGWDDPELVQRGLDAGAVAVLAKGHDTTRLLDELVALSRG